MSPSTKQPPTPHQGGLPPPVFCFALYTEINHTCRILGKFPVLLQKEIHPLKLKSNGTLYKFNVINVLGKISGLCLCVSVFSQKMLSYSFKSQNSKYPLRQSLCLFWESTHTHPQFSLLPLHFIG